MNTTFYDNCLCIEVYDKLIKTHTDLERVLSFAKKTISMAEETIWLCCFGYHMRRGGGSKVVGTHESKHASCLL